MGVVVVVVAENAFPSAAPRRKQYRAVLAPDAEVSPAVDDEFGAFVDVTCWMLQLLMSMSIVRFAADARQ
jgi:hypothetical protein